MLAEPACCLNRIEDGHIVDVRNGMDGSFRLLDSPTLMARYTLWKNHVILRLVVIKAKILFLVRADVIPRKAFNNIAKCSNIEALHTLVVEAHGDRIPRFATRLNDCGQAASVRTQGGTGNQQLSPKGGRSVGQK